MVKPGVMVGRGLMLAVPAALGLAAVLYLGELKSLPEPTASRGQPAPVRVITLEPIEIVPRVAGFGLVEPVREWRAIARIEGEVAEIAEPLAPGDLVQQGVQLFRIDDSDLRLDLAQVDAQLAASRVKDETVRASLQIARADLELVQAELQRQEQLQAQGVVTQSALETSRRQELTARTKATELENQLVLNAAERDVLTAQRASLEYAIGFASVRAPYDLRVTELSADLGQYVSRGQALMAGEGIEAVDIAARFPIGRMGPLLRLAGDGAQVTDLSARVRLAEPEKTLTWKATVQRVGEAIDERTQSAPVVVRVTDPLAQSKPGERPPLRRNMFVEVELSAPKRKALVVPAEAVQDGMALVVSAESKLEKRPVQTGFTMADLVVVTGGLTAGDMLVITDPSIAVPGMDVKPVEDEARKAEIAAEALNQPPGAPKPGSGGGGGAGGGAGKKAEAAQ